MSIFVKDHEYDAEPNTTNRNSEAEASRGDILIFSTDNQAPRTVQNRFRPTDMVVLVSSIKTTKLDGDEKHLRALISQGLSRTIPCWYRPITDVDLLLSPARMLPPLLVVMD